MFNYPTGSSYSGYREPLTKENQLRMLEGQIEALKSTGSFTSQMSLLEEIHSYSSNLSEDEKKLIEQSSDYREAKNLYETGFMAFLSNKFSHEYITTPQGKLAGEKLLEVIKNVKSKVQQDIANKNAKLQKIADLLDKHPELLEKLN